MTGEEEREKRTHCPPPVVLSLLVTYSSSSRNWALSFSLVITLLQALQCVQGDSLSSHELPEVLPQRPGRGRRRDRREEKVRRTEDPDETLCIDPFKMLLGRPSRACLYRTREMYGSAQTDTRYS